MSTLSDHAREVMTSAFGDKPLFAEINAWIKEHSFVCSASTDKTDITVAGLTKEAIADIVEVNDIHSDTIDFVYEDKFKDTTTHEIITVPICWVEISEEEFFYEMKNNKFRQLEGEMLNLMKRINEVKSMAYKHYKED